MDLFLLRHGDSVSASSVGGRDFDRTLSPEGVRITSAAARGIAALGFRFDIIATSPYPRAEQTARIVRDALDPAPEFRVEQPLASGATPAAMADVVRALNPAVSALIVGHNPDMEDFAGWLISTDASARVRFSTGTLAHLSLSGPPAPGAASLLALYPAASLCR